VSQVPGGPSLFVTGPCLVYVGYLSSGTYSFLGTAQRPPRVRTRRGWVPVYNDLGGTQVPFDLLFAGQEAFIIADMNRFKMAVMQAISSMPNTDGIAGLNTAGDIGTLMQAEGAAFALVLVFPYAVLKPAMRAAGLPGGLTFPCAVLEGPDDLEVGTVNMKKNLIFHCIPGYNPANGSTTLYINGVPSGLPPAQ